MHNDIFSRKKNILGVTWGIAAYNSCYIVRELIKANAEVRVVMTPSAVEFVASLNFSTLSNFKVLANTFILFQQDGTDVFTWYVGYTLWADLMIIAPSVNVDMHENKFIEEYLSKIEPNGSYIVKAAFH